MSFEATQKQEEAIRKEIVESTSPISALLSSKEALGARWSSSPIALAKVASLVSSGYTRVRLMRPDGNCLYRAFAVSLWESVRGAGSSCVPRLLALCDTMSEELAKVYPPMVFEDYADSFKEQLSAAPGGDEASLRALHDSTDDADCIIIFLRFATASAMLKQRDLFEAFVPGGVGIEQFCNSEVMPMGREAEEAHIVALASAFEVHVSVAYMDNGEGDIVTHKYGDEDASIKVRLIYQPGHYDVLYKSDE